MRDLNLVKATPWCVSLKLVKTKQRGTSLWKLLSAALPHNLAAGTRVRFWCWFREYVRFGGVFYMLRGRKQDGHLCSGLVLIPARF